MKNKALALLIISCLITGCNIGNSNKSNDAVVMKVKDAGVDNSKEKKDSVDNSSILVENTEKINKDTVSKVDSTESINKENNKDNSAEKENSTETENSTEKDFKNNSGNINETTDEDGGSKKSGYGAVEKEVETEKGYWINNKIGRSIMLGDNGEYIEEDKTGFKSGTYSISNGRIKIKLDEDEDVGISNIDKDSESRDLDYLSSISDNIKYIEEDNSKYRDVVRVTKEKTKTKNEKTELKIKRYAVGYDKNGNEIGRVEIKSDVKSEAQFNREKSIKKNNSNKELIYSIKLNKDVLIINGIEYTR